MKRRLALTLALATAAVWTADAHAVDEYVQALRVGVGSGRITLSLSLTPGSKIAPEVLGRIDRDDDSVLSPQEAEAYGRVVLDDLTLTLDGVGSPLSIERVELPTAGEIRAGQGVIRLELAAPGTASNGPHRLVVRNAHLPAVSVYLANALMPEADDVQIVRQARDQRQQLYELEYDVSSGNPAPVGWLVFAGVALALLVGYRITAS